MKTEQDFTKGKILPALLKFALPILLSLFLQAMYGAVDLQVVGKFGTAADISAVSTGSMIMQTITIVITGLAVGVTVILGQKIGERKPEEGGDAVGVGICMFAGIAVIVTALMVLFAPGVSRLMKAPADAFDGTVSYVRICSAGAIFITAYNLVGSVFRGMGDSKMPLITVMIACALNIGGDLLLTGVFGMGVKGVAIATVFAQAVSVLLSLLIIRRRQLPFTLRRESIRFDFRLIGRIFRLGFPVALQDLLVGLSFLVIIAIANNLGTDPSAGVGVAEKLCAFIMLIPSAFAQSMTAYVAQNIGASLEDRAKSALKSGILLSFCVSVVVAYFVFFHGDILASIFADDPAVIAHAWEYLKPYGFDSIFTSFLFCFIGYFNGRGETIFVMVQGLVGSIALRTPLAFLMNSVATGNLFMLGLSTPISTICQIVLCFFWFIRTQRKLQRS